MGHYRESPAGRKGVRMQNYWNVHFNLVMDFKDTTKRLLQHSMNLYILCFVSNISCKHLNLNLQSFFTSLMRAWEKESTEAPSLVFRVPLPVPKVLLLPVDIDFFGVERWVAILFTKRDLVTLGWDLDRRSVSKEGWMLSRFPPFWKKIFSWNSDGTLLVDLNLIWQRSKNKNATKYSSRPL